ncbi:hypothetical protein [Piscibacillus halophilus]|uniref:Uncharacterized protein n=2 Tax=Piscibacillus halophilus TaxID=571933 RepID=A0A1H9KIR2_9BACI|nr:hypothetical protein [Piscibacillus halophilus]SEQ98959.1 hypothetical protein SAMN05216362_13821 [Piscibacillus halophilus]
MDKKSIGLFILIGVVALATYWVNQDDKDQSNHYYVFNLDGESENWDLNQYQIELVPTNQTTGGGMLHHTGDDGPIVDSLNFRAMAMIDGVEVTLQSNSVHEPIDVSEVRIDLVNNSLFKPNGDPVMFDDIEKIYAVVEWLDSSGEYQEERLELYEYKQ